MRIFLDTCVLNLIVENSEAIFDGYYDDIELSDRVSGDVFALSQFFQIGSHVGFEIVVSETTFNEVLSTADKEKASRLRNFCTEIWLYQAEYLDAKRLMPESEFNAIEDYLVGHGFSQLKDSNDRRLLIQAAYYGCNFFCTRDWKTILKYRQVLNKIKIQAITPMELMKLISGEQECLNGLRL